MQRCSNFPPPSFLFRIFYFSLYKMKWTDCTTTPLSHCHRFSSTTKGTESTSTSELFVVPDERMFWFFYRLRFFLRLSDLERIANRKTERRGRMVGDISFSLFPPSLPLLTFPVEKAAVRWPDFPPATRSWSRSEVGAAPAEDEEDDEDEGCGAELQEGRKGKRETDTHSQSFKNN